MEVDEGEVESRNLAESLSLTSCFVLDREINLATKFLTEELRVVTIDGVTKHDYATTPEPAETVVLLHVDKLIHCGVTWWDVGFSVSTTAFHDGHAHPLLGVATGIKEFGFDGGVIEDKLVLGWVGGILWWLRVEKVFSERDPLCIPISLLIGRNVEVSRSSVGILAVASSLRCRCRSRGRGSR